MEQTGSKNLLQYDDPMEVATLEALKKSKAKFGTPSASHVDLDGKSTGVSPTPEEEAQQDEMETVINTIFPPEEFRDDQGNSYRQQVSRRPATLEDAKELEFQIDHRLKNRHGRIEGICNIRRELYNQAFDELIRQEALEFPERGFLLKRIRDEIQMTYSVYKSLYDSCMAYQGRKYVVLELTVHELEKTIAELEPGMSELRRQFKNIQEKVEQAEIKVVEETAAELKRRNEEKDYYNNIGNQMKAQIDKFLSPPKKSELKSDEKEKDEKEKEKEKEETVAPLE